MADIEYSDKYGVYLTPVGIQFLTNATSIEIMKILETKSVTLTDVSKMLDIPLSSAQSNMSKLSRSNFVTSHKDENDSRKTYYVPTALIVIESTEREIWINDAEVELIKRLFEPGIDRHKTAVALSSILPIKHGISIGSLLEKAGMIVAAYTRELFEGLTDEELVDKLMDFSKRAEFPEYTIELKNGNVTLKIERAPNEMDYALPVHRVMAGFITKVMSFEKGVTYCRKSIEISKDKKYIEINIVPYDGTGTEVLEKLTTGMSNPKEYGCDPFAIYSLIGGSMLFANSTQIAVLDLLGKNDMTLKDMAETLNILPITLHVNLAKLMDVGAVSRKDDSKNTMYSLTSSPLVKMEEKLEKSLVPLELMFKSLNTDPSQYFKVVLTYIMTAYRVVGIGMDYILRYAGADIAEVMAVEAKDMTAEEYLDYICKLHVFNMDLKLESHIPLKFTVTADEVGKQMLSYAIPFISGAIRRGLKIKTGVNYSTTFVAGDETVTFYDDLRYVYNRNSSSVE